MELISPSTQIEKPFRQAPHLVILGAGASVAATPQGDRKGLRLPVMATLSSQLGLDELFEAHGLIAPGDDFEAVYSDLIDLGAHPQLVAALEARVNEYFASLELPDSPTIYDHLVLSLRSKDAIATFNWDPFLWQALQRNHDVALLPAAFFLHGNTAIGSCTADRVIGDRRDHCRTCGAPFAPSRLLYPVKDKDYATDPVIMAQWSAFEEYLEHAYLLTVFGYGAPTTDAKAMEVMKTAWQRPGKRELEEVEIVDIRPVEELECAWAPFIVRTHCRMVDSFFRSTLARWPRRSCEAIYNQFMMLQLSAEHRAPIKGSLAEVQDWYRQYEPYEH